MTHNKRFYLALFILLTIIFSACVEPADDHINGGEIHLQLYIENPFYWQINGEPVLLIGASDYHNIFQRPDLVEHLEKLHASGGNYIRNTMA